MVPVSFGRDAELDEKLNVYGVPAGRRVVLSQRCDFDTVIKLNCPLQVLKMLPLASIRFPQPSFARRDDGLGSIDYL